MIFTHVSIKLAAGENLLSAAEWEALPLADKTRAILSKSATFLCRERIVPIAEILAAMKQGRAA
ncbi:MAG TPA: hypothetical protein VIN71_11890 [Pseudomonadales bacterium]